MGTGIRCDGAEDTVEGRQPAQGGHAKYYKQRHTKSDLLEACCRGDVPGLKVLG